MSAYLIDLTVRLATGVASLPEPLRESHGGFLLQQQREDGGFAGRMGESDLYYTGFALRSMAILGLLDGEPAQRAAAFIRQKMTGQETIVDFLSLLYGASLLRSAAGIDVFDHLADGWKQKIASHLETLRRDDGGYAKGPQGRASSTYHTFLVILSHQLLELPTPNPELAGKYILSRQHAEGGFLEMRVSKRAGTNPTAAAIGCLKILDMITPEITEATIDFLFEMQTSDGGLRANTRIPIADVLSTFTGLLTLEDLGGAEEIELPALSEFLNQLQQPAGGFFAAEWDQAADVEYTFYGLGSLALLTKYLPQ